MGGIAESIRAADNGGAEDGGIPRLIGPGPADPGIVMGDSIPGLYAGDRS